MDWLEEVKTECACHKDLLKRIRMMTKHKEWRLAVIRRDEYTCQKCNKQLFLGLHAHHKKSISEILFDNKITTYQDALNFKPLWDINNGESLCTNCHPR